jgi:hypothetical protein
MGQLDSTRTQPHQVIPRAQLQHRAEAVRAVAVRSRIF